MAPTESLRQRRGNNKKAKKAPKKTESNSSKKQSNAAARSPSSETLEEEETLWETFIGHPIVKITIIVLLPYCIYHSYYYLLLQHPPSFLLARTADDNDETTLRLGLLRPAVAVHDERQVLIVGTLGAGLGETASALYHSLRLEIALDASDTTWHFARDGTVGSFHGLLRYSPAKNIAAAALRADPSAWFHPKHHRSTSKCSHRVRWDACWARECLDWLTHEWGCGLATTTSNSEIDEEDYHSSHPSGCTTPFRTTLLQVRHPLRTLATLRAQWCTDATTVNASFGSFLRAVQLLQQDDEEGTCLEILALYVLRYNRILLEALDQGALDGFYQVETASACAVARLAGLETGETVVYPPNAAKFQRVCGGTADHTQGASLIQIRPVQNETALEWEDLQGGTHGSRRALGDRTLELDLRALANRLGYDD